MERVSALHLFMKEVVCLLAWRVAPACPAIGGGSEVTFKPLVSRLTVREGFSPALTLLQLTLSPVPADKGWLFELDRGKFQLERSVICGRGNWGYSSWILCTDLGTEPSSSCRGFSALPLLRNIAEKR
ncbi:hypothetical protein J6590_091177 [Homalodisca vitripennis]|nr:hypothetical protein J6590_091177 [Homalodisca vitripennis]